MGVIHTNNLKDYWAQHTNYPPISERFSRSRFRQLHSYFHIADNDFLKNRHPESIDKIFKIRELYDSVRSQCLNIPNCEYQCIDEQMIPYKGKPNE